MFRIRRAQLRLVLPLLAACFPGRVLSGQADIDRSGFPPSASLAGDLTSSQASRIKALLAAHDYTPVEALLLAEIHQDPTSVRAARLLSLVGHVYFLAADYGHAAIAWKKSEKIAPLEPSAQFSLAMVYIQLGHPAWARPVLESLSGKQPDEALYPYWLGRLDYDAQHYDSAIAYFHRTITLRPDMARAYDNLGLCYFSQNKNSLAIESYRKAIELERDSPHPSAWPHLNLATALHFLNRLDEAKAELQETVRLDPALKPAHYELGLVLEAEQLFDSAIRSFSDATRLDSNYAEPHYALARIYRKQGRRDLAQQEVEIYQQLRLKGQRTSSAQVH